MAEWERLHRNKAEAGSVRGTMITFKSFGRLALVVLAAAPASVCAQQPRFEVTAHAGPALGWLRGNRAIDGSQALLGMAAGAALQYDLTDRFGLRVGASHQRKGASMKTSFTDVNGNVVGDAHVDTQLDYLMVPLLFRASFGSGTRISIGLGPYAGYLLNARQAQRGGGDIRLPATDLMAGLKQWDLGVSASLGAAWPLGERVSLNAEARYDKGLSDISALPVVGGGSIRTTALSLLVGVGYRFGGTL